MTSPSRGTADSRPKVAGMPRRPGERPCLVTRLLALALMLAVAGVGGGLAAPGPALAAGGGGGHGGSQDGGSQKDKITKRPRDEAAKTGGTLIQLETMWIPIRPGGSRMMRFTGMTVQLVPNPDKMAEACYATPWVTEALIIHFHHNPLESGTSGELMSATMQKTLLDLCARIAGAGVFTKVLVVNGMTDKLPSEDEELSLTCV